MNVTHSEPHAGLAAGVFHIRTSHETLLQCGPDGELVHSANLPDAASELVLYVPETAPALGFLMTMAGNVRLRVAPDGPALVVPLRIQRDRTGAAVGLCHPYTGNYLSAVPVGMGEMSAPVVINRLKLDGWEIFSLLATEPPEEGTALAANVAALKEWAALPLTGPQVLHTLEGGEHRTVPGRRIRRICQATPARPDRVARAYHPGPSSRLGKPRCNLPR